MYRARDNSDTYSHDYAYVNSNRDSDGNSYANTDSNGNNNGCADGDPNTDANRYTYGNADAYGDADTDRDAYRHPNCNSDSYGNTYRDPHVSVRSALHLRQPVRNANTDSEPDPDQHMTHRLLSLLLVLLTALPAQAHGPIAPPAIFAPDSVPGITKRCPLWNGNRFEWGSSCGGGGVDTASCHKHKCANELCYEPRTCSTASEYQVGIGQNGDAKCLPFGFASTPVATPTPTFSPTVALTPPGAVVFVENGRAEGVDEQLTWDDVGKQLTIGPTTGSFGDRKLEVYGTGSGDDGIASMTLHSDEREAEIEMGSYAGIPSAIYMLSGRGTESVPLSSVAGDDIGTYYFGGVCADNTPTVTTRQQLLVEASPLLAFYVRGATTCPYLDYVFAVNKANVRTEVMRILGDATIRLTPYPNCDLHTDADGDLTCPTPSPTATGGPTATATPTVQATMTPEGGIAFVENGALTAHPDFTYVTSGGGSVNLIGTNWTVTQDAATGGGVGVTFSGWDNAVSSVIYSPITTGSVVEYRQSRGDAGTPVNSAAGNTILTESYEPTIGGAVGGEITAQYKVDVESVGASDAFTRIRFFVGSQIANLLEVLQLRHDGDVRLPQKTNCTSMLRTDADGDIVCPTATATPTPTATATSTTTASLTPTVTISQTPTATATPTVQATASPTASQTPANTPEPVGVQTAHPGLGPEPALRDHAHEPDLPFNMPVMTPTATASVSPSPTATRSPTPTRTATPILTATAPALTSTPTATATATASISPTATASPTGTSSPTPNSSPGSTRWRTGQVHGDLAVRGRVRVGDMNPPSTGAIESVPNPPMNNTGAASSTDSRNYFHAEVGNRGQHPNNVDYLFGFTRTTTSTLTTIVAIPVAVGETVLIEAVIIGYCTSGTDCATVGDGIAHKFTGGYTNKTGIGLLEVGIAKTEDINTADPSGASCANGGFCTTYIASAVLGWMGTISVSGSNVIVRAQGSLNTSLTWHANVTVTRMGP